MLQKWEVREECGVDHLPEAASEADSEFQGRGSEAACTKVVVLTTWIRFDCETNVGLELFRAWRKSEVSDR